MDNGTALDFFCKGMEYAGRIGDNEVTTSNKRRFKGHFGTTPGICAYLWPRIINNLPGGAHFYHLLWGLLLVKIYASTEVLAGMVGGVDEKTFRKWNWKVLEAISLLKPTVVSKQFVYEIETEI